MDVRGYVENRVMFDLSQSSWFIEANVHKLRL